jgi:hypothetical protein
MSNGENGVNRRQVRLDLKDVYGNGISDKVRITFRNQRADSLSQEFMVQFSGSPVVLPEPVPAFPFGGAELEIQPTIYRFKNLLVHVPAGDGPVDLFAPTGRNDHTFFVDPRQASPKFPDYDTLKVQFPDLIGVLENPQARGPAQWWSANWWNDPGNNHQKGGLLNLYAKTKTIVFPDPAKTTVFSHVREIWRVLPARLFAIVDANLLDLAKSNGALFHHASKALHKSYDHGWRLVDSYKSHDVAGNLQLTFAEDQAGEFLPMGLRMADIDIDDHQDIRHAFDVIQHTLSGTDSNPYDIHEILVFFQNLDPGYKLV